MHQTRQHASTKLPLPRKGTKYVARASSHLNDSVPVVIAIRDMLGLARTAREVKKMIFQKTLKINGRPVRDHHQSIQLMQIFEADKVYQLSLLPTGKFTLQPASNAFQRCCKVINRSLSPNGKIQLNFHDGSNIITQDKDIKIGDSVYLDFKGDIKKYIPLQKGKATLITGGKYIGREGTITDVSAGRITLQLAEKEGNVFLEKRHVMLI